MNRHPRTQESRTVSLPLRASMCHEQGLAASGYYRRRRTLRDRLELAGTLVLLLLVTGGAAYWQETHHQAQQRPLTAEVDRREIIRRLDPQPEAHLSYWIAKQQWLLTEQRQ